MTRHIDNPFDECLWDKPVKQDLDLNRQFVILDKATCNVGTQSTIHDDLKSRKHEGESWHIGDYSGWFPDIDICSKSVRLMSNGVTHSIYNAAVCGLDIQIGNVGGQHGRAEGQQGRIRWLDESEDGWLVGRLVGRSGWLQAHMETKRRWRLSTHGRLGGGVLYTQLQLHLRQVHLRGGRTAVHILTGCMGKEGSSGFF